jgi:hypothetical protein
MGSRNTDAQEPTITFSGPFDYALRHLEKGYAEQVYPVAHIHWVLLPWAMETHRTGAHRTNMISMQTPNPTYGPISHRKKAFF